MWWLVGYLSPPRPGAAPRLAAATASGGKGAKAKGGHKGKPVKGKGTTPGRGADASQWDLPLHKLAPRAQAPPQLCVLGCVGVGRRRETEAPACDVPPPPPPQTRATPPGTSRAPSATGARSGRPGSCPAVSTAARNFAPCRWRRSTACAGARSWPSPPQAPSPLASALGPLSYHLTSGAFFTSNFF